MEILAQQILDGVENPGELWEYKDKLDDKWSSFEKYLPGFHEVLEYRLKPKLININGYEVPEPERVAPKHGTPYYTPSTFNDDGYSVNTWYGDKNDFKALENGTVHIKPENAEIHGKAIYSFTKAQS